MQDDSIAASQKHLALPISDEQYRAVLAVVDHWQLGLPLSEPLDPR